MIKSLFQLLDANPGLYWLIGWLGTILALVGTAWQWRGDDIGSSRRGTGLAAVLLLSAVVFAWRWPALLEVRAVSVSEARLIAGALTLERDPQPFHSLDMAGAGPLGAYLLLPTHVLGVRQDYFNARLMALLLDCGTLAVAFACLRSAYSAGAALLGLLPFALVLARAGNAEVAGYSTAHVVLFLCALAAAICWGNRRPTGQEPRGDRIRWLLAGFCLGLLPWADAMGAVLAVGLWLLAAVVALADAQRPWAQRLAGTFWCGGSALYLVALILAMLYGTGCWQDFWTGFVRWPPDHAARLAGWSAHRGADFMASTPGLWLGLGLAVLLRWFWPGLARARRSGRAWMVVGVAVIAGGMLGWQRDDSAGWLILGAAPLALGAAVALGEVLSLVPGARAKGRLALGFAVIAIGGQCIVLIRQGAPGIVGRYAEYWRRPRGDLAQLINATQRPGDTLAVWGSGPHFHVETGLAQAVRTSCTVQELAETVHRDDFFRPRYLADLQRNEPAYFIDATGTGDWAERGRYGHENFPQLAEYVRENYRLARDDSAGRLYLRLKRQIEINLAQPGVSAVDLKRLQVIRVFSHLELIGGTRVLAHAPSLLTYPIPPGARRLRGIFGIVPDAYANPAHATSGARFMVSVLGDDARREQLIERWLRPLSTLTDRGPVEFVIEIPGGDVREIEFSIDTGASNAFAWTYWGELRFEGEIPPPAIGGRAD